MHEQNLKTLRVFATLIIFITIIASIGGLFMDDLYRDNPFVTLVWKTTDLVTLLVVVPLLAVALIRSRSNSAKCLIIIFAMLDYTLYNFAYYLFGAAFNWFFIIYAVLFVLSGAALITGFAGIDADWFKKQFRKATPVKWISGFMMFVAGGLTIIYVIMIFDFIIRGNLPVIIENTGHITNVVFALDFSLVIPVLIIGAIWLWKRKPWGYIFAGFSVIKGSIYTLVLTIVSLRTSIAGFTESAGEIPLWAGLTFGGIIASLSLILNIKSSSRRRQN